MAACNGLRNARLVLFSVLSVLIGSALCAEAAKTKIVYSFWGKPDEVALHQTLTEAFVIKNPDIDVELMHVPGNYEEKLLAMVAGGSAPDVMFFKDEPFPEWVRTGVFEDLHDRFAADRSIVMRDFFPQTREYFQYKGRQVSLPAEGGPTTILFNRTLFQQSGLRDPVDGWTVAEFIDSARRLTRDVNGDGKADQFGFTAPDTWYHSMALVWMFGGRFLDVALPDRQIAWVRTNTPQAVEGFRFMQDIRVRYGLNGGNWLQGSSAMTIGGPWDSAKAYAPMAKAGWDWDIAHMPKGPTGVQAARQSFDTWTIWSGSTNKDAAYRFVSFALSIEGQRAFTVRAVPARISAAARYFVRPETPQAEEVYTDIMQRYGWMQPTMAHWTAIDGIFSDWVGKLMKNTVSPEEAGQQMYREGNAVLQGSWPAKWRTYYAQYNSVPAAEADELFALDRQLRGGAR